MVLHTKWLHLNRVGSVYNCPCTLFFSCWCRSVDMRHQGTLCVGLARTIYIYIYIYGLHTVLLAGKSPNIRSCTVYMHSSGQPYTSRNIMWLSLPAYSVFFLLVQVGRHETHQGTLCVGLARTIYIYGLHTVLLAGKPPNIRSCTVYIHGSGQPYTSRNIMWFSLLVYSAFFLLVQVDQHEAHQGTLCTHTHTYTHTHMIFTARVLFLSCWCRSINMKHIKEHYFTSHPSLNTYAIVPVGGKAWWEEPHNRGA